MKPTVNIAETFVCYMSIDLGRSDVPMPEKFLYDADVNSLI